VMTGCAVFAEVPAIDPARAVYINGVIMDNNLQPLGVKLMEFAAKDSTKPVSVIINSPGGEVNSGYIFVDYMARVQSMGVKVNCYVKHIAASMAFQIFLYCDNRYIISSSLLLWHPARVSVQPSLGQEEAAALAAGLAEMNARIFAVLLYRVTGISEENLLKHWVLGTLHTASDLNELTHGKFMTVVPAIPGLLEITPGSITTNTTPQFMQFRVSKIIYVYKGFSNAL